MERYRLIPLCNVDYKIFTKIIASRLQYVMSKSIGAHQTRGIKGRSIQTNIYVACCVLQTCTDTEGRLLYFKYTWLRHLTVFHDVLFALERVNIGTTTLNGIKLCYTHFFQISADCWWESDCARTHKIVLKAAVPYVATLIRSLF